MAGRGISKDTGAWFNSNKKAAKTFGNHVYSVYLDIKHPYIFTAKDRLKDTKKMDQIVRDVKAGKYGEGYDGVIFRNVEDVMHYFDTTSPDELVGDVYVVFRPEQIKEISNKEFGKTNPDIYHQNKINPESKLLQQFKQQIIDMGHPEYGEDGAEAIAQLFEARIRAFAKYAGIEPDEYLRAKNFKFIYDKDPTGKHFDKRGRSEFVPEKRDANGNIIREAQTIIRIFNDADRSTILHELGHVFLKDLRDLFAAGRLTGVAKQDGNTLIKWLGVSDIDFNGPLSEQERQRWTDAHEKFATGFEKYLMTGQAPTAKLKRAFEAFKRWLTNIYHSIRNITYTGTDGQQHSFTLSDEIKQVFDRMLDDSKHAENYSDSQEQFNFDKAEGFNQSKRDNTFVDPDTVENYNQRTFYATGTPLQDNTINLKNVETDGNIAWGIHTTQSKYESAKGRTQNLSMDKKGRVHLINDKGEDAYETMRNMPQGLDRQALSHVIDDLMKQVTQDTSFDELSKIKAALREKYSKPNYKTVKVLK